MTRAAAILPILLALALLVPGTAAAEPGYSVSIWSMDYQPGHPVFINVTGPFNMSISIRVTDVEGNIVAGRDAALDEFGSYTYDWSPQQDGDYNVTVGWSTGFTITRPVLVQQRVTPEQIGLLYQFIYGVESRLRDLIVALDLKANVSIALAALSLLFSGWVFSRVRKTHSPAVSEFEKFMRSEVEGSFRKLIEKKK